MSARMAGGPRPANGAGRANGAAPANAPAPANGPGAANAPAPANAPGRGNGPGPGNMDMEKALAEVKSPAEAANLPGGLKTQLASAAAWSPDPKNPPLYLDLPMKDGVVQQDVLAKWAANAPLAFVDQYIDNLRRYHGIAMDVGDQDGLRVDAGKLHTILDNYGLNNSFEIYPGTHTSAVADRFQNHVMPFFSQNLCFQASCPGR